MKRLLGVVLAIIGLATVLYFGDQAAGPVGALLSVSALTTLAAYAFNGYALAGRFEMGVGTLRPLVRGESNLGSIVHVDVFTELQFTQTIRNDPFGWPKRQKGPITGTIPVIALEKPTRWRFDVGSGKGEFAQSGPITNQTFKHMLEGKLSGYMQEHIDSLDDVYNMGLIVIATYSNGKRVVYGSTRAPLLLSVNGSTEVAPESDGKGISIKMESIVGCDFKPNQLDAAVVVTPDVEPVYPAAVGGVTP